MVILDILRAFFCKHLTFTLTKHNLLLTFQILREMSTQEHLLTSVVLSHSGRMLFGGTNMGSLWSVQYPLTSPGAWQDHQGHGLAITKVRHLMSKLLVDVLANGNLMC